MAKKKQENQRGIMSHIQSTVDRANTALAQHHSREAVSQSEAAQRASDRARTGARVAANPNASSNTRRFMAGDSQINANAARSAADKSKKAAARSRRAASRVRGR